MTITYRYIDWPAGAFDTIVGSSPRLGSIDGLVENMEGGTSGSSSLSFDDLSGTLGRFSDGLTGHKMLVVEDDRAPAGNRRVYTGLIGPRQEQSADSLIQGVARRVTVTLYDLNVIPQLRELRGSTWRRPAETAKARMQALIAAPNFMGIVDDGNVSYPSHKLEKADLRGRRPADVLDDIARQLNWEWGIYWSESAAAPALYFDNANRSSRYASTLRLSNVLADVDSSPELGLGATKTFAVYGKPVLTRDPARVFSGVSVPWKKGNVHVERATTATAFISRDGVAPSSSPKSKAAATRLANKYLDISDEEADRIVTAVQVPAARVNDIRAGHLLEAKFRNLRGYADFSYFRVKQRAPAQPQPTDDRYVINLVLAPAKPFTCQNLSDVNQAHGTVSVGVSQESGFSTWAHASLPNWFGSPADDPVTAIPGYNTANANDGSASTYSYVNQQVLRGTGCVSIRWTTTLDATYTVCSTKGTYAVGSVNWQSHQPNAVEYWDGSAWQTAAGSISLSASSPTPAYWTFTFREPVNTTKVALVYTYCGTAGILGLWSWNNLGTRLYDWQIIGAAA